MHNITITNLVTTIEIYDICGGVKVQELSGKLIHHVVPKINSSEIDDDCAFTPFNSQVYVRSRDCEILLDKGSTCWFCSDFDAKLQNENQLKQKKLLIPAKRKAPLSKTAPQKVALALKQERLQCAQLQSKLNDMKTKLETSSVFVDSQLSNDLINILSDSPNHITPFMNLFWQQQKKLFQWF